MEVHNYTHINTCMHQHVLNKRTTTIVMVVIINKMIFVYTLKAPVKGNFPLLKMTKELSESRGLSRSLTIKVQSSEQSREQMPQNHPHTGLHTHIHNNNGKLIRTLIPCYHLYLKTQFPLLNIIALTEIRGSNALLQCMPANHHRNSENRKTLKYLRKTLHNTFRKQSCAARWTIIKHSLCCTIFPI